MPILHGAGQRAIDPTQTSAAPALPEPVRWHADGSAHSQRFDDVYSSSSGALQQARHVFLQGCGLPAAWARKEQCCILETGFGLGRNFLATWQAWNADPQRCRNLHFVSIEAWPVSGADLLRAMQPHPELLPLAQALHRRWLALRGGCNHFSFAQGRLSLTLWIGEVLPVLQGLQLKADALYLDGFCPSKNPQMWTPDALRAAVGCLHPGARVATWSVTREVRHRLSACGVALRKMPGLPPKRDCLSGVVETRDAPAAGPTPDQAGAAATAPADARAALRLN